MRLADNALNAAEVRQLLRYRWVIFAVIACNGIVLYFHFAWGATLSSYHSVAWNLNARQLGLLAALGFFPYALMQIPGGYLTDRFGARKVISGTVGVLALGSALFAGAPNFPIAVIARVLMGASSGVIMLPAIKVLARWFRVREFATVQGAFILLANIGPLLGTLPLALAAERWGWREPMWAAALLTGIIAGATWALIRDDPTDLDMPPVSAVDPEAEVNDQPPAGTRPSLRTGFRAWIGIPTLWANFVIFFATFGSLQAFQALWAGPLLRHVRGLSVAETGSALITFTIGTGLGPILFGFLSDRVVQARKPIVLFVVTSLTALWLVLILTFEWIPLPFLYLIFIVLSALTGGVLVAQVIIKELCPPHLFGTIYGIHNGSGFYGTAIFQLITGAVLTAIGPVAIADEPIYSAQAYAWALSPIFVIMVIAALLSFKLGETLGPRKITWPERLS